MMKRSYIVMLLAVISSTLFTACKDTGRTLPSATGSIYEMLIVMDNSHYKSAEGEMVRSVMAADMPCLPQMEPYFTLSQVSPQMFDNFLKPTRNILMADVNAERYTQVKVYYQTNVYSQPQALCRIQSPSWEAFADYFAANGEAIRSWFVREELRRQGTFYKNYAQTDTRVALEKRFEIDIRIPDDYLLVRDTTDLVWCVNDGGSLRRDLVVWSYDYESVDQLTAEALIAKRNEVLGANVTGSLAGTYMGTEMKHFPPQLSSIAKGNLWCGELRGLWKMQGGEAMGGPFVEHTMIDEVNHKIITAEVFIFAPGQKKRNPLRQAEAILYTIKLAQERNQLKEIQVKAE